MNTSYVSGDVLPISRVGLRLVGRWSQERAPEKDEEEAERAE